MSDQPSDPSSIPPPPQEQSAGEYSPPPPPSGGYQSPPPPPTGGFQPPPGTYQPPGTPPPVLPTPMAAGAGGLGFIGQFRGNAGWACLIGIITIAVPFIFNRVFFFLPIIGVILAILAITRSKQMIGGIIGIVLNVIGGIITVLGLTGG